VARIKVAPEDLGKALRKQALKVPKLVRKGARRAAQRARSLLVKRTPVGISGHMKGAWKIVRQAPTSKVLIELINDAPYAAIVEYGARPHPVSIEGQAAIALWAQRKLGLTEAKAKGVAFLIARKIRKEGQAPTYFIRDSLPEIRKFAQQEILRAIEKGSKKP